jgi:anti-anti-sigma factor
MLLDTPEFSSRTTVDHGQAVVTVCGELDLSTVGELSRSLGPLIEAHPREVILELGGLGFIDSTGLSLLVKTSRQLGEHHGTLGLAHPTPPVRRVLEIVGLDQLLVA